MKLLVTHLTRMGPGYICVAGVDAIRAYVRPVLNRQLPNTLLETQGGPFAVGNVVDLGDVTPAPNAPEVEDHVFDPASASSLGRAARAKFSTIIQETSSRSILEALGDEMKNEGRTAFFEYRTGSRSLAHLAPGLLKDIYQDENKIRARVEDGRWQLTLSVTDVRFFNLQNEVNAALLERVRAVVAGGKDILLSVGVGRPFWKMNGRHYLQVNGIFPADDPYWEDIP